MHLKTSAMSVAIVCLFLAGCASVPKNAPAFSPAPPPPRGYANVYIYRIGAYPTLRTPTVEIDGTRIFDPPEGAYTVVTLPAGKHVFTLNWARDTGFSDIRDEPFELESGEQRYWKISGSYEVRGGKTTTGTFAVAISPPVAQSELRSCCRYIRSNSPAPPFTAGPVASVGTNQDAAIARILRALRFGDDAKAIIAKAASQGSLDAEAARSFGSITEEQFVEIAVPLFRPILSTEEAEELATFYESDAMQDMLAEQERTGSGAPVATTQEQAAAVRAFYSSNGAQTLTRLQEALRKPEFHESFAAAVEGHLSNTHHK